MGESVRLTTSSNLHYVGSEVRVFFLSLFVICLLVGILVALQVVVCISTMFPRLRLQM